MNRLPRQAHERILTRSRLLGIVFASAVMAAGTLAVVVYAPGPEPQLATATTAGQGSPRGRDQPPKVRP